MATEKLISLKQFELKTLYLMVQGLTCEEIAKKLLLSKRTIEKRLSRDEDKGIYRKIGVNNRAQAIAWYVDNYGLPDDYEASQSFYDNWEFIRGEIVKWLSSSKQSADEISIRYEINTDTLSNFITGDILVNTINRRTFLQILGLLPIAMAYNLGANPNSNKLNASSTPEERILIGTRLISKGIEYSGDYWENAIPLLYEAEKLLGPKDNLALRAALMATKLYLPLGDIDKAEIEINRMQRKYKLYMDPVTEIEILCLSGWLSFSKGDYQQALRSLNKCLDLTAKYGDERLGEGAQHLLGRVYFDLGLSCPRKKDRDEYFHKAGWRYEKGYQIHLRNQRGLIPYDLLRKSQLLRIQSKDDEAEELRCKAKDMFTKERNIMHAQWEESVIDLFNKDLKSAEIKAEEALMVWGNVKYAKGLACAMDTIGDVKLYNGKYSEALERYVAALCIYPFEKFLSNRKLMNKIHKIGSDIVDHQGRKAYQFALRNLEDNMEERRGYFKYLNRVSADRSGYTKQIFKKLSNIQSEEEVKVN